MGYLATRGLFTSGRGGVAGCNIKSGQILVIDQKDLLLC